ncbi:Formate hydrogenlyase subunit 4 [Fundidesulfovibrio magnetotacticus]|uniref:Formate hydrogenlyase subunit 4 n=1 Tax=Fundidesulfovibrio magnetotacticus TaxID=2730080 RepID=A0A6V8LXZ3_9BACT|nr:complex I subunit 1 family protein [Fundidesulfovibrio magnetotacticus]GFK94686.1 Formate hydrogenlyase subunit 4 [Fundidesulfovibrio magnetotacticus]
MTSVFEAAFALLVFPGGAMALSMGLFLKGVDRRVAARLQRRVGPPLLQPLWDVLKLCAKETLIPATANEAAFLLAPVLGLAGVLVTAAVLPIGGVWSGVTGLGDLLLLLYLLPIPAMAFMVAGSASSSPYGALGFSREMVVMCAYELPLIAAFLAAGARAGGEGAQALSLAHVMAYQAAHGPFLLDPVMWPALAAMLMFIPGTLSAGLFDIPEAEPEVLEGPLLEYSGPLLAAFNLMSAVKLVVVLELVVALFWPNPLGGNWLVNLAWHVAKCLGLMLVCFTTFRVATGRLRLEQGFAVFVKYAAPLALASLALAVALR